MNWQRKGLGRSCLFENSSTRLDVRENKRRRERTLLSTILLAKRWSSTRIAIRDLGRMANRRLTSPRDLRLVYVLRACRSSFVTKANLYLKQADPRGFLLFLFPFFFSRRASRASSAMGARSYPLFHDRGYCADRVLVDYKLR